MKRRNFLRSVAIGGGAFAAAPLWGDSLPGEVRGRQGNRPAGEREFSADLVIAGGGLGGCAAAVAALRNGLRIIMTEETDWIGGQLTQQGLSCPDEHPWIETYGATRLYRELRSSIRAYYRRHYPLTEAAASREYLNPGNGNVSRLCHEPRVALAVLYDLLAPYLSSRKLLLLLNHKIIHADVAGDRVRALTSKELHRGGRVILKAPYFIDATELGDLLPLTGTAYRTGSESKSETNELHAPEQGDPHDNQAFTYCFAMDYIHGADHTIDKPRAYNFWRNYRPRMTPPWPGKLLALAYTDPRTLAPKALGFQPEGKPAGERLNLWNYRRIIDPGNFKAGTYPGGITVVNWPQNDFFPGNLIDAKEEEFKETVERSKQLSLSLFYWLQTEAPRPDGGQGWPGLRLRGDIMGTEDGLAKYPYIRESRRIQAVFTILEEHVGAENRALVAGKKSGNQAADFYDSVGVGYYHIDLHPGSGGKNYIDFGSLPFQIPLGALLPRRMKNLLPGNKNIGTTHLTNGCYRLHPVEWNIGESAGMLAAYALKEKVHPHAVREDRSLLEAFQDFIRSQGIETHWPKEAAG